MFSVPIKLICFENVSFFYSSYTESVSLSEVRSSSTALRFILFSNVLGCMLDYSIWAIDKAAVILSGSSGSTTPSMARTSILSSKLIFSFYLLKLIYNSFGSGSFPSITSSIFLSTSCIVSVPCIFIFSFTFNNNPHFNFY